MLNSRPSFFLGATLSAKRPTGLSSRCALPSAVVDEETPTTAEPEEEGLAESMQRAVVRSILTRHKIRKSPLGCQATDPPEQTCTSDR
jgi:hypothetical protein